MHRNAITVEAGDGFNLRIMSQVTPPQAGVENSLDLTPIRTVHHWFAGKFTDLPLDRELLLRICMAGQDVPFNKATVEKWQGLYPLLTYAEPMRRESYEWFRRRADGQWISGDLCKCAAERLAGSGRYPEQQVLPAALAAQGLAAEGDFWSAWQEMRGTTARTDTNHFEIRQRFASPSAAIAIHPPFTYTYLQQLLWQVQARQFPGVFLDEIGDTRGGRKLQVIRVEEASGRCRSEPATGFANRRARRCRAKPPARPRDAPFSSPRASTVRSIPPVGWCRGYCAHW